MKILIISGIFPTKNNASGGIFIRKRNEILKKNKVEFEVYSQLAKDSVSLKFLKLLLKSSHKYYLPNNMPFDGYKWNFIEVKRGLFDILFNEKYFNKRIQGFENNLLDYSIISVHWVYPEGYLAYKMKKKYNIPYVITLHGSDIHTFPFKNKKIRKYTLIALENADYCIFISNSLRDKAIELGYSNKNAIVISNGFDANLFKYRDKELTKKSLEISSKNLVGFVGNIVDVKNVMILPNIFYEIQKANDKVSFVIVGDGELRNALEKKMNELKINCIFTGRLEQEKVSSYMQAMDIMILPSKSEGFGTVVLEAQACGTYVVGSNIGGIPEAIGPIGKVFNLDNKFIDNMSTHILDKLKNGYDKNKLISRANNYTWDKTTSREIQLFTKIYQTKIEG